MHHISFNASDCQAKLTHVMYPDSAIVKKTSCGRTKSEALITDVLGPKTLQRVVDDLTSSSRSSSTLMPKYFSLATDASNVKNRKMFPVCVHYFTVESGINRKLLDFVELNDEHSTAVGGMLVKSLTENQLDISHVVSYAADNASVNYGSRQSVMTELLATNPNILKANCNAHVVHNTLRKLVDVLDRDVETIVTCVYSHFSISANRRIKLKEFFDFVDIEYHELLRHVPTRWLSLGPAIDRLLQSWAAVVSYFVSLGEDCPKRVAKHLSINCDDHDCDSLQTRIVKAYLLFVQNLCNVFENSVKKIEKDDFTLAELLPVMQDLRGKIQSRINDRFFSAGAQALLCAHDMQPCKQNIEANFIAALQEALNYLEKWFSFADTTLASALHAIALNTLPDYQNLVKLCTTLGLQDIDLDALYDEFAETKTVLQQLVAQKAIDGNDGPSVSQKWQNFFRLCGNSNIFPLNIFRVVSAALSIPGSNAFSERVFSLMSAKWRADRNRASIALIKSELQVYLNFGLACSEFYDYAVADSALLAAAASGKKYYWRRKGKASTDTLANVRTTVASATVATAIASP